MGPKYDGLSSPPRAGAVSFAVAVEKGLPTEAALSIEALSGNPKKMTDSAWPVRDFQPPFGAVAKPRDCIAYHVRACHCGFVPSRSVVRQIDRQIAWMRALPDSEFVTGHAGIIQSQCANVGSVPEVRKGGLTPETAWWSRLVLIVDNENAGMDLRVQLLVTCSSFLLAVNSLLDTTNC
jgi:hypothetical protein